MMHCYALGADLQPEASFLGSRLGFTWDPSMNPDRRLLVS